MWPQTHTPELDADAPPGSACELSKDLKVWYCLEVNHSCSQGSTVLSLFGKVSKQRDFASQTEILVTS